MNNPKNTTTVNGTSVKRTKTPDAGPGGKIPLPDDHPTHCAGNSCWCKHY